MKEINFNCPKCGEKEFVGLEKRTIATTYVDIGKKNNKYYSLLNIDYDKYAEGHVPVSHHYEQFIFVCRYCDAEFLYAETESFNEFDKELDKNKLKQLGLLTK